MMTSPATLKQRQLLMRLSTWTDHVISYDEALLYSVQEASGKISYLLSLRDQKIKEFQTKKLQGEVSKTWQANSTHE
jgi:hypothetical protein